MSQFHLGVEGDTPDEIITPKIEAQLESLGVPIPQEIDMTACAQVPPTISMTISHGNLTGTDPANPKDALGMKKPNLALVPTSSSLYQAQAMMDGAAKYGPYNWRTKPVKSMVYISAAMRHLGSYLDGETIDPISGVPHLGHALACLGILADATEVGNMIDDRPTTGPAGEMIQRFNETQSFKK